MKKMFRWTLGGVLLCSCMCAAVADGPDDEKKDNKNYVPTTVEYGTLDKNINIDELKKKSKEGDIVSMYNLGWCYHMGQNVTRNYKNAIKYYKMAIDKGSKKKDEDLRDTVGRAANNLALIYLNGQGVEKDVAKAVELYTVAANLGNKISQRMLGECYEKGEGVEENAAEAVKWYTQAAEQKDVVAMTNLARCYALGNGVEERDLVVAANWYRQAAEYGYTEAQYNYGRCLMNGVGVARDFDGGLNMYRIAADKGHMEAQYELGEIYFNASSALADKIFGKQEKKDDQNSNNNQEKEKPVDPSAYDIWRQQRLYDQAFEWFEKAAAQGHAGAMYMMGVYYAVSKNNPAMAFKQFEKAAQKGHPAAQCELGTCYATGRGVRKNLASAAEWFQQAADYELTDLSDNQYDRKKIMITAAQFNLGVCYYLGDKNLEANQSMAADYFAKAAKGGLPFAQFNLGVCYLTGNGIDKNQKTAVSIFNRCKAGSRPVIKRFLSVPEWFIGSDRYGAAYNLDPNIFKWYVHTAKANESDYIAEYNLGWCYFRGIGITKNEREAFKWFLRAANDGYVEGQYMTGYCYVKNLGVDEMAPDDRYEQGVKWLRKAYQKNAQRKYHHARSGSLLGECYEKGWHCRENLDTAVRLYRNAAASGDAYAMYRMGYLMIHGDGRGIDVDEEKGIELLRKAAKQRTVWGDNGGGMAVGELRKLNQWDGI